MKFFVSLSLFFISIFLSPRLALAIDCEGDPPKGNASELQDYQNKCIEKINSLQNDAKSLKATIGILNSKINLTNAQIRSTTEQIEKLETEIKELSGVITGLNSTLDQLSVITVARVRETYMNRYTNPLLMFFADRDYSALQNNLKYLSVLQKRDQIILNELETTRVDLDHQKTDKEVKQAEVTELKKKQEAQKIVLARQQTDKQRLLIETQNSESKYQTLLAKAVAELAAIESIIAGRGSETEVGDISGTQKIASVIPGPSACSTGAHLHFEVVKDKAHRNPSEYLKSEDINWSNQPDSPFSFGGGWDWPVSKPIRITQGYGHTAYAARYVNGIHTGIDMLGDSYEVRAVKAGKLYRGSIACGGGTLKYARVHHKDENIDTYYLHVNYF
jgi:peptidoglycan hydrolase CwlO-like protein